MRLKKVFYELYESETTWLEANISRNLHYLDREVHLEFDDNDSLFISWKEVGQGTFHGFVVHYQNKRHFNQPAPLLIEVSQTNIWKNLIGKDLSFEYCERYKRELEIISDGHSVWCWTEGEHGSDVLHLSASASSRALPL